MAYEMQLRAVSGAFYGKETLDAGAKIVLPNMPSPTSTSPTPCCSASPLKKGDGPTAGC